MAANTNPVFVLTPVVSGTRISTSNSAIDGSGTLGSVVTGSTNGTRIDRVTIKANATTAAGMIRLFVDDDSGTIKLINEIAVSAITASATVASFSYEWVRTDTLPLLVLPNTYILKAGTSQGVNFDVVAYGGNF